MVRHAQGGCLTRWEGLGALDLSGLGSRARRLDGLSPEGVLELTWTPDRRVVRVAYASDEPLEPRWYWDHHALARLLSERVAAAVHGYCVDPSFGEVVCTYGNGQPVGGEALRYDEVDVDVAVTPERFERIRSGWPLGRLAGIYGVSRSQLARLERVPPSATVALGARAA